MNKKKVFSLMLFLFFALNIFFAKSNFSTIKLDKNWSYSLETNIQKIVSFDMKPDENKFTPIPFLQLYDFQNLLNKKENIIWLKVDFFIPNNFSQEDLACDFGRISMNDQTWLNGVYIGGWGTFEKEGWNYWNKTREYKIPGFLIRPGSTNTIYLRVYANQKGLTTPPIISKSQFITEKVVKENFIYSTSYMLVAAILLLIGLYNIFSFSQTKCRNINIMYAIICIVSAIYASKFFITELPGLQSPQISYFLFQKIISYSLVFILLFFVGSYFTVFYKKTSVTFINIIRIIFLIIPIILIFTARDYTDLTSLRLILFLLTIPHILYIMYLFIFAIQHKNKKIIYSVWSFLPLFFTIIFDLIIHAKLHLYFLPYFSIWGWMITIILQFFILSRNITTECCQLEKTITKLEAALHEKSKESILANENLITINKFRSVENEQKKQALEVASFVQENTKINKIPNQEEWNIAYSYKSQHTIANTIYDFFIKKDKLYGITLFTVPNYNLSSVLLAMLTNYKIQSFFYSSQNLTLHKIMQKMNTLFQSKKNVLKPKITGILIRINNDKIEYVNAGHPDVLHRSAKTGKVHPIKINNKNIQGPALGSANFENKFISVAFTMRKNDVLFIYTKSLIECKNATNEKFGTERLAKILSECMSNQPSENLNKIETSVRKFCEPNSIKDDLAMIILQKK